MTIDNYGIKWWINNVDIHALKLMCSLLDYNSQMVFIGYCEIVVSWNWCVATEKWISWEHHMNKYKL